ncbi:hypothetical protein EHW67_09525, partial [Arenibacter aquaticus]
MKNLLSFFIICFTSALSYAQVHKTNNTTGTITNVTGPGAHIDRTFSFSAGELSSTSLTEVELSLHLIIGNGTPPTTGPYGIHEDLNVRLISPSGTFVDLVQDRWGYNTGDPTQLSTFHLFNPVNATVNFDDDNPTNIETLDYWQAGNYAPHNALSAFDGENAAGTWTLRISDGNSQFSPQDYFHFVTATLTITSGPSNNPPAIFIDNSNLAYTEGETAKQIDNSATVSDADGDADWNGGSIVAQITANAEAADELSIGDADGDGTEITISGTNIYSNGVDIGNLSASGGIVTNGTALTITFDSDATNANIQEVLQSIRYRNTSTNPGTSNRTVTITAADANAASANDTRTITIAKIPEVTSVAVPSNATYITGQNLDFTINFNENITVNTAGGTPQLNITIGATTRQATYQSGSGTSALLFRYTVQAGELDTDGITVGSLAANGGTLRNNSGNDAVLTLNSVGSTTAVLVDAVAPIVTSVNVPANATYIAGQNLDFTINTSENVTVNTTGGTPQLSITIGATTRQATYQSGSGSSALLFRYTVQAGELDT